ncbi:MAG: cell division protein FtsW [Eubacterium sp.]|jgi:cell division protein FtsW|nr:cell division protein FtsW [Eubacterium sp.]
MKNKNKKPFDFWIFAAVIFLLSIGTIMVFSSSYYISVKQVGNSFNMIKPQLMYMAISIVVVVITMNYDYHRWGKMSPILLMGSIGLLILVLIPGVGKELNGAQRWLGVGDKTIQPSELAKLSLIMFLSFSLSKRKDVLQSFTKGLLPYLALIGFICGLVLIEPHLSGAIIIAMTGFIILFCAGAKISHFVSMAVPAVVAVVGAVLVAPYRFDRVKAWLDPFNIEYKMDESWQIVNSLLAIGSGGLFGRGLGQSMQKYLYIPEPYNDYIFAVLAEELGFLGSIVVLLLFLVFIWRGIKVAMNAPDVFGSLMAIGITALIGVQALFNVAVVTNSIPSTGISLPFFSAGGTSLIFLMFGVGILLNISRYSNYERF